jgi:hypothetical protein
MSTLPFQYRMKVSKFFAVLSLTLCWSVPAFAQFAFLFEPMSQSASPGADVLFLGTAYGPEPITYQWRKNGVAIIGSNLDYLYLANLAIDDAGDYDVVAWTSSGAITSQVAVLTIDATFTKVLGDPLVNEGGNSLGCAWGDYDNDGDLDVFVAHAGTALNSLFRNDGGSFTKVSGGPVGTDYAQSISATWADYDDDGWLDLLVLNSGQGSTAFLYRNNGNGTFTRNTNGLGGDLNNCFTAAWADYNKDGWLDVLLGPLNVPAPPFGGAYNGGLYRNNGTLLTRQSNSVLGGFTFQALTAATWADFDNDGDSDMFFAMSRPVNFFNGNEVLIRNDGNEMFTRLDENQIVTAAGNSTAAAWADIDNDGDLDVYVPNVDGEVKFLFRNDGNESFTRLAGEIVAEEGAVESGAWGDYDNDGWLDLFVANNGSLGNFLFHNEGSNVFTKVQVGSPTGDRVSSSGGVWVDVDNDGDMDLFLTNYGENNYLYRNNGNTNAWLSVRLSAYLSNRSAIGAKVRVLATIDGVARWQMREIASRDSGGSPNSLRAEFGLGDAASITTLRVEWPSGLLSELHDVTPNQFLSIIEPPTVWVSNAEIMEGDTGTRDLNFSVYLTEAITNTVTVDFRTFNGTASAGAHYIATNGTLSFAPGETNIILPVSIIGNLVDNADRTFTLRLSNSVNIPLGAPIGTGTILDDDPLGVSAGSATLVEGNTGATQLVFSVTLNKPWNAPVTVDFTTLNSSALAGEDYVATNGTLLFAPGEVAKEVRVSVLGDTLSEINEVVFVDLLNPNGVTVVRRRGGGTILDDDPLPLVTIGAGSVVEGDSGTRQMLFPVSLSPASGARVSFTASTADRTATAPGDYTAQPGTAFALNAGLTNGTVSVAVQGDTLIEGNETFLLRITSLVNALIATNQFVGTISDDDLRVATPIITGNDVWLSFSTSSNRNHRVERTFSLSPPIEWTPLPGAESVAGTGTPFEIIDPGGAGSPQRFYRVILLP